MRRRTFMAAAGAAIAAGGLTAPDARAAAAPPVGPKLTDRDPLASANARAVYAHLVATYYAAGQVCTGGAGTGFGQNFDWGRLHAH
ncbi:hypothetical protein [Streptomyces sp. NPDC058579]|uniref:hypothetical protein n=1 Tax=Streptomyces sp. NPDC058579 TaxID=3346548 RepID=UPI003667E21E